MAARAFRLITCFTAFKWTPREIRKLHTSSCLLKTARNLKGKKISSQIWLQRQLKDPYVEKAKLDDYRCRSAYKLLEIHERYKVFSPGSIVIDCGAAPGSWTQVALKCLKGKGSVISIDLQSIPAIEGAIILENSDFTTRETQENVLKHLKGSQADVVMSDMAPKASGIKSLDHDQIIDLCLSVLKFSTRVLKEGGTVICKLWQGDQQLRLENIMKQLFGSVKVVKPKASRTDSAEIFLLGTNFSGKRPPK